jgi:hypothetical protein
MSIFKELSSQYYAIENVYAKQEFHASTRGWLKKEARIRNKRAINDQTYFIFMFSRLENKINQAVEKKVTKVKSSRHSWKLKAPWENLPKVEDIAFKNRVAILFERGKSNYNLVLEYYTERNSIAHGGGFKKPISMPAAITDLEKLYRHSRA